MKFNAEEDIKPVSATTNTITLSNSIIKSIEGGRRPVLVAMGRDAVNQAVKALARSRSMLLKSKYLISWYSYFEDRRGNADGAILSSLVTKVNVEKL